MLNKDTIDRAIMARLLDAPAQYPQWPLHYLIGCYGRAATEIRGLSTLKNKDAANRIQLNLQYCKELIASNAGLLLTMSDSLFPQVWFRSSAIKQLSSGKGSIPAACSSSAYCNASRVPVNNPCIYVCSQQKHWLKVLCSC